MVISRLRALLRARSRRRQAARARRMWGYDSPYRLGAYDYKHGLYVGDPDGPADPSEEDR